MKTYTEQDAKEYAEAMSKTISIRFYENGCSSDYRRCCTDKESDIIKACIYGALLAIRDGHDAFDVANAAEYIALVGIGETPDGRINAYDTVYCRINEFLWPSLIAKK